MRKHTIESVRASVVAACVAGLLLIALPIAIDIAQGYRSGTKTEGVTSPPVTPPATASDTTTPSKGDKVPTPLELIRAICANVLPMFGLIAGFYWIPADRESNARVIAPELAWAIHVLAWGYLVLLPLLVILPPIPLSKSVGYMDYLRIMLATPLLGLIGPVFGRQPEKTAENSRAAAPPTTRPSTP